jgi:5-oxoprolinase (ATP-hydrolysing)
LALLYCIALDLTNTPKKRWEFWIDRGGTFTDIVAKDPSGHRICHKVLSENLDNQDAALLGIREILGIKLNDPIPLDKIASVKMGTTVATNALLERKGEKVILAITKGLGDALHIGYQNRPMLFALNIVLPPVLYADVIEIKERIDAHGKILEKLDEESVNAVLTAKYKRGFRAIAIVLMHGYRYPQHEQTIAKLAQAIGFTQISISHRIAPVIKLVSRGDTTVLDAYLSPVLQHYIQRFQSELGTTPLFFMQSNGGLINATLFQGKDSIFSGPAAGVIGMVKTCKKAGFHKAIGFDMGGTSTDVSHYAGEYERVYSSEINGIKLRTPMMLIHTIASGGGSILHFAGHRFIVGPDSAGANPGPACYGCGGPLTITDANVLLGKIQVDSFPQIVGPLRNQAIDANFVRQKFQTLTENIIQKTNDSFTPEQVAEGYIKVAVENMANAIQKISVQRGDDVTHYLLNCFGGAAGQHACLVADRLGIKKILIHPLAGVLSAYGIGLAEIRILKEQTVAKPLHRSIKFQLYAIFNHLALDMKSNLVEQGVAEQQIQIFQRVHLRYEDSDTTLIIDFKNLKEIRKAFNEKHRKYFGFIFAKKKIMIESVSIEAVARTLPIEELEESTLPVLPTPRSEVPYRQIVTVFTQNNFHKAPIYDRSDLIPGDCITGCAIITEKHATTIVEPGWKAEVTPQYNLLLYRHLPLPKTSIATQVDPVMLEIFNRRFMNIAEQMGEVLRNTASSINIKERLDFSCAIFNHQGELVANAPHIPVHLGSMSVSVKRILQSKKKIQPGDVYLLNSPYHGGTHLPDMTLITPVFNSKNNLLFLVGSRGHHADIGGITPGSVPAESKHIEEEGVLINGVKIVNRGRFLEKATFDLFNNGLYPARNPKQNLADLKAQIAANECGIYALKEMIKEFSLSVVHAYMQHVRDNAKACVERLLTRLADGKFCYFLDDGSKINVSIKIDKRTKRAKIDFNGSAKQHTGNFNAPMAVCQSAVLYVLRCLVAEDIPLNSGCLDPIELIIPSMSILNPTYPAAVVAGNVETSQCIVDALFGALQTVAASQGTCNNFTFGNSQFQYYETICGGAGAGPGFHGASAVHTHMTNTLLTDPEILEYRYPVLLEEFTIRCGSGGTGEYRGGDGVIRRIRFLEVMTANIISSHRKIPPYGLAGGGEGKVGHNWLQRANGKREELSGCACVVMNPGDVFVIETPGGGGYGHCY